MRPQAAKTYLEKHHESFKGAPLDDLIKHGLRALQVGGRRLGAGGKARVLPGPLGAGVVPHVHR